MKIIIYTTHYLKPEFIEIQHNQLKKYCIDLFELIVVNNGKDEEIENKINSECSRLNIKCINIQNKSTNHFCSQSHNVALEYTLKNHIIPDDKNNITVIMDSDIFAFKKFSFIEILNNKKVCGLYQQRDQNEYFSAIFTLFYNNIDISRFSFFNGIGDTGSGTFTLMKENECELVKHTAAIDLESDYIFRSSNINPPYKEKYKCQFIHDCFIHYYRGSNWAESDPNYHDEKLKFVLSFLSNPDLYNIHLDDYVFYDKAHSNKGYNGVDRNYNNYKFLLI
jgi:hypothetical protein